MSVNLYLTSEIKKDESFVNEERGNKVGSKYQQIEWASIRLNHIDNNGIPVFTMSSLDDNPPVAISPNHIQLVTAKESFVSDFPRRIGMYTLPNPSTREPGWKGEAILDLHPATRSYELSIKAPSLGAARALYHGIRKGTLVPYEPWDMPSAKPNRNVPLETETERQAAIDRSDRNADKDSIGH